MNTPETVTACTEGALLIGALIAVTREAVKRPWVRFSVSWSFAILPADKRDPAPRGASRNPAAGAADTAPVPAAVPERRRVA